MDSNCAGLWSPIKQNDGTGLCDIPWSLESGTWGERKKYVFVNGLWASGFGIKGTGSLLNISVIFLSCEDSKGLFGILWFNP